MALDPIAKNALNYAQKKGRLDEYEYKTIASLGDLQRVLKTLLETKKLSKEEAKMIVQSPLDRFKDHARPEMLKAYAEKLVKHMGRCGT